MRFGTKYPNQITTIKRQIYKDFSQKPDQLKVVNIHTRIIHQSLEDVVNLINTLATENDQVWPVDKWPRIKFKDGLFVGSRGGHGPIRYSVQRYVPERVIEFKFLKPRGFHGIHKFEIEAVDENRTRLKHTIDMATSGMGTISWAIAIRWLHDALIEDLLDRVENWFNEQPKVSKWNLWVSVLRRILK